LKLWKSCYQRRVKLKERADEHAKRRSARDDQLKLREQQNSQRSREAARSTSLHRKLLPRKICSGRQPETKTGGTHNSNTTGAVET